MIQFKNHQSRAVFLWILTLLSVQAQARMRSISIAFDHDLSAPRWMSDTKAKVKGPPVVEELVGLKRAQINKKWNECYGPARKLASRASGLKVWLALSELDCALKFAQEESNKEVPALSSVLDYIEQNPKWLLVGAHVSMMKPLYLEGLLVRFERRIKRDRRQAWTAYDQVQMWFKEYSSEQKARAYRAGGELAFLEQNINLAIDLYSRSLSERDSAEVRRKLESVRSALSGKKEEAKLEGVSEAALGGIPSSNEEKEIAARMENALKLGDLISAVEDGVKLIQKVPGSTSAKVASDRILDIYLSLGSKTENSFIKLRERAVDAMVKADATRLYRWANNAFVKSYYQDALRMSESAVAKFDGQPESTKAISIAGNSAFYLGEFSTAEKWFERLTKEHGGSEESRQAMFRLGLIQFRSKKFVDASAYFERLLAIAPLRDWEYLSLHWHWRAQQRIKANEAAKAIAEKLVSRYPLTYYGLRARAELNGGLLTFAQPKPAQVSGSASGLKSEFWLSEAQSQSWERLQLLLKAGWFDEAQAELAVLPEPITAEDKLVRARLLATAFDHYNAVRMFNEVWSKRPELFQWAQAKAAFPFEFQTAIEQQSKANTVDADLIRGLIRQESTFRAKVISPSNAYGVMQILPSTAQDVLPPQKAKNSVVLPDDLFNPDFNIRIGTTYLSRLIKSYKGHVPLALAAYNAGTGRVRRWLGVRADLKDLEGRQTSNPEDEIWIDELPWEETSLYVKAILRNLLIYQLIEKGEVKASNPLWNFSGSQN